MYPFDRLIKALDEIRRRGLITDPIFAQIGRGQYRPQHMEWARILPRDEWETKIRECSAMIGHAGVGTLLGAIAHRKPLLVVPRRRCFGEHVNDHQVQTARKFASRRLVLAAFSVDQIVPTLEQLADFRPAVRPRQPVQLIERLQKFLKNQY